MRIRSTPNRLGETGYTTAELVEVTLVSEGLSVHSVTERGGTLYVVYELIGADETEITSDLRTISGAYAGAVTTTANPPHRLVAIMALSQGDTHYEMGHFYVTESWARSVANGESSWNDTGMRVMNALEVRENPAPIRVNKPPHDRI